MEVLDNGLMRLLPCFNSELLFLHIAIRFRACQRASRFVPDEALASLLSSRACNLVWEEMVCLHHAAAFMTVTPECHAQLG